MIRAARLFAPTSSFRLIVVDALVVAAAFYLLVRFLVLGDPLVFFFGDDAGAVHLLPIVGVLLLAMYFAGLYSSRRVESRIFLFQQLTMCAGVALISQALITYLNDDWTFPRLLAMYGLIGCVVALFGWRVLRDALLSRLEGTATVLILGTDESSHRLARYIAAHPAQHLAIIGSLTDYPERAVGPVLGGLADLRKVTAELKPDMIVSGLDDARDRMPVNDMVDLRYSGSRIEEVGAASELICRRVSVRDLRPSRLLFSNDFDTRAIPALLFAVDVASATLLLLVGAPFALIYAACLALAGGPVFQSETCAGYQGKPFVSRRLHVGRKGFLAAIGRGLHLGSWPQLWNVLLLRMSFVGPRPQRLSIAGELGRILPCHEYRLNSRPGITGWAQINLREGGELDDAIAEVEHDLYYIRNQSISLYAYVLLHGLRGAV